MGQVAGPDLVVDQSLGKVARLVGHDLRNKLCVMKNSLYYLEMRVGRENEKVAKHLDLLLHEIGSSNDMIMNLMDILAPKEPSVSDADLNVLLHLALHQRPAPAGVDLRLHLAPEMPLIALDAEQVSRAIENILLFEYASLREGAVLRIVTRCNGRAYIEFIDSGPGLSEDELDRLCDLHDIDGPSSLPMGLVVARRLIEKGGGSLEVESRPGVGTRFSIILPI